MTDNELRPEQEPSQGGIATPQAGGMDKDWNPDAFPTSANTVFKMWGLLAAVIVGLCLAVNYLSDHSEKEQKAEARRKAAESSFLGEEVDEGTGAQALDPGE